MCGHDRGVSLPRPVISPPRSLVLTAPIGPHLLSLEVSFTSKQVPLTPALSANSQL